MADWYVYQDDGEPLGPWTTEAVAESILAGKFSPEIWVAPPGGARWLRALDVPVIARLVEGIPTRPRLGRGDAGLRPVPGTFTSEAGQPVFGATMMIVGDHELERQEEPATTRKGLPVSSGRPDDTAEMAALPQMSFRSGTEPVEETPSTDPRRPPPPS